MIPSLVRLCGRLSHCFSGSRDRAWIEPLEGRMQLSTPSAGPAPLLPDLTPWISRRSGYVYGWRLDRNEQPGRTLLRLTSAIANIGQGALEVRGGPIVSPEKQSVYQRIYQADGGYADRLAGTFEYHPTHHHTHFDDFAAYRIRAVTPKGGVGPVLRKSEKVSFCLTDSDTYDPSLSGASPEGRYFDCSPKVQGISVGWADVYDQSLPEQWLDVTDLPSGKYWMEVVVDPRNRIAESNDSNNTARLMITLRQPGSIRNDNFADRIALDGASVSARASNLGAGVEEREPDHAGIAGGSSLWWSWTAPFSGKVAVSTRGSSIDTLLAVYTGDDLARLSRVAANDDAGQDGTSRVVFNAVKGRIYQIAVDGYQGMQGMIRLNIGRGA